jgi:hypothetical protein
MNIEDLNKIQAFIEANTLDREAIITKESSRAICVAYRLIQNAENKAEIRGVEWSNKALSKLLSNTIIEQI